MNKYVEIVEDLLRFSEEFKEVSSSGVQAFSSNNLGVWGIQEGKLVIPMGPGIVVTEKPQEIAWSHSICMSYMGAVLEAQASMAELLFEVLSKERPALSEESKNLMQVYLMLRSVSDALAELQKEAPPAPSGTLQ